MATRYSGNAVVNLKWSTQLQGYETSVSVNSKNVWHGVLGAKERMRFGLGVDSPEAYDEAAINALAWLDAQAEEDRFDPSLIRPAYDQHGRIEVARNKTITTITGG